MTDEEQALERDYLAELNRIADQTPEEMLRPGNLAKLNELSFRRFEQMLARFKELK